jgi:hypothetical protein
MQAADVQPSPTADDAARLAATPAHAVRSVALRYALVLACAFIVAAALKLRVQGIFACPDVGSGGDRYVAYCNASGFGDFDHGAFWFALEPEARRNAAAADVLFVGSSRMQFAFSTQATARWFAANGARHYLLGFSHTETVQFTGPLLAELRPSARAYVINVDRFFDDRLTPPARAILKDGESAARYREKRSWLGLHRWVCGSWPTLCGNEFAFVRNRADGSWLLGGAGAVRASAVGDGKAGDRERWNTYIALAREFVARLPVGSECTFLTIAPYEDTMIEEATAIAAALGLPLVSPRPDGLRTFDGSHLDPPSAERWSAAYLDAVGPRLQECLRPRTAS